KPWLLLSSAGWVAFLGLAPTVILRYAFPAYPGFLAIAGQGAGWLWMKSKEWKSNILGGAVLFLGLWHAASVAAHFSNQIGYFNDLVPLDEKRRLLDSGYYDLGQDLKRLGEVAQE